jgi:hypothetical protein
MMFDLQSPTDANYNKQNILCGTRNDLVVTTVAVAAGAANPATNISARQVTSGEGLISATVANPSIVTNAPDTTMPVTYCLNLISLIGTLCSQNYIPLFAMTSSPLRVEIQLIYSDIQGVCAVEPTTHVPTVGLVNNVEYIASMIELGDSAMSMIESSLDGKPLQFVFGDYRNYQGSYQLTTATTTQITFPIPAKFTSLKSLFVTHRDQGTGAQGYFPFSCVNYGLVNYQFRLGPTLAPSKQVDDIASMFSELTKAIGSMSDLHFTPSIRKTSYLMS